MHIGSIAAGIAFLILPGYGMIDIMPDFIGAFLIILGLRKLRDTDERLNNARSLFMRFLFIDLIKNILIFPVYSTDETTVMTVCFIFSIILCILLFAALSNLFEGLYYVYSRAGSKQVENNFTGVKAICSLFAVASYVFLMIPQLVVLTNPEYSMAETVGKLFSLYDYKITITLLCTVLSALLGIVFGYSCIKYIVALMREKHTASPLDDMYASAMLNKAGLVFCRANSSAFSFIFAGLMFFCAMRFEGVNIIPTAVGMALCAVGFAKMKYIPSARRFSAACLVFTAVCVPTFITSFYVSDNYFRASTVTDEIFGFYILKSFCDALEFALVAVTVIFIFKVCVYIVKNKLSADTDRQHIVKATVCLCLGLAVCAVDAVLGFFVAENDVLWLPSSFLSLVYALYQGKYLASLYDRIESKYL